MKLLEDVDYDNAGDTLPAIKDQVTKSDWGKHWGEPCEWYIKGCIVCDMWQLWTDVTGEVIEYEGHEEDCECSICPVDESAV